MKQRRRRRPSSTSAQAQLARRLGRQTARELPADPSAGKEGDPRTELRKSAKARWKAYSRVLRKKDRLFVLLHDATTHTEMVALTEEMAELDQTLRALDHELDGLEDQLRPLAPTTSTLEIADDPHA